MLLYTYLFSVLIFDNYIYTYAKERAVFKELGSHAKKVDGGNVICFMASEKFSPKGTLTFLPPRL